MKIHRGGGGGFPWPPEAFLGLIRWFPGPFLIDIFIYIRLVRTFSGSVESFPISSYTFPGSPDRLTGPPGTPDTFPGHIGQFP